MDNDVYGHVNNVVYYSFFDTAVNRYLIDEGVLDIRAGDTVGFVVETSCSYEAVPDRVTAGIRVARIEPPASATRSASSRTRTTSPRPTATSSTSTSTAPRSVPARSRRTCGRRWKIAYGRAAAFQPDACKEATAARMTSAPKRCVGRVGLLLGGMADSVAARHEDHGARNVVGNAHRVVSRASA